MKQEIKSFDLIKKHYRKYPNLQIRDLFKFIHQSSFGCEHMVESLDSAVEYIREEFSKHSGSNEELIEPLDGEYSRVSISYLEKGLSPETLGKLFYLSAKEETEGLAKIREKLKVLRALTAEKELPFSLVEFDDAVAEWQEGGFSALHHSDEFRASYSPSYRVISNRYIPFLPLFTQLDQMLKNGRVILAVEGGSASGKTTLSEILKEIYDPTVFHIDDFFLRPEQRTEERFNEVGGNFDRERFLEEVLIPLSKNEPIDYRRFDCSTFTLTEAVRTLPKRLTVIEGAYSMHPELRKYYDLSVFLEISPKLQKARIEKRNSPEMAKRFFEEWIPLETKYFSQMKPKECCDIIISVFENL